MAVLKIRKQDGTWAIVGDQSAIKYTQQDLTNEQKQIARENINATNQAEFNDLKSSFEILNNSAVLKNATDQTIVGDIVISGNLTVTGETDIQENDMIIGSVTLPASNWVGSEKPYTQVVELPAASEKSKIDILLNLEQLEYFKENRISLTAINEAGVVTFYALSNKPATDLTLQISITEVVKGFVETAGIGTFLTKTEGASKEYVNSINETTEKRLERLENKLAPEYIVEDHEYAYEKTVPYYSCKYADLEWMDGYSYVDSEGHLKDAKVTEIVSECANLWDINFVDKSYNKDQYEKTETGYITAVGTMGNGPMLSANAFLSYMGLKAGDTITCSAKATVYSGTTHSNSGLIMLLAKNSSTHSNIYLRLSGSLGKWTTRTATIPEDFSNDTYYGIYFYGSNQGQIEFSDFVISKGSEKTPYQEYREPTVIVIPEEVQAIEGYGRKGTRLNFEDKTLSVTYGEYTFTGNESWAAADSTNGFYRYYTLGWAGYTKMPSSAGARGICNRYPNGPWTGTVEESVRFGQSGTQFYIYLSEQKTSAEIQALTAGMVVHYPLKSQLCTLTPVDIDFDGLLPVGGIAKVRFENEDKIPVQSKITYMLKEDAYYEE